MHRKDSGTSTPNATVCLGLGQRSQRDVERRDADWRRQSGGEAGDAREMLDVSWRSGENHRRRAQHRSIGETNRVNGTRVAAFECCRRGAGDDSRHPPRAPRAGHRRQSSAIPVDGCRTGALQAQLQLFDGCAGAAVRRIVRKRRLTRTVISRSCRAAVSAKIRVQPGRQGRALQPLGFYGQRRLRVEACRQTRPFPPQADRAGCDQRTEPDRQRMGGVRRRSRSRRCRWRRRL